MSDVKIAYRIMAVRERQELVADLLKKIDEPETSVFWDEEHRGAMWNAIRIWGSHKDLPSDVTHICLLADDADVVNRFKDAVQKCVERFPNAIWTFANRPQVKGSEKGESTPYMKIWNCWVRGISYLIPVNLLDGWLSFYGKYLSDVKHWTCDDTTTSLYALLNDIDVMMPIPNLVVGKDVKSVIPGHTRLNRDRDMSCWQGYDIDLDEFDTDDYVVSKTRAGFEFHLHHDEEVLRLAKERIARKKNIEKLLKRSGIQ